jgi:hypothetical protein
VTPFNSLPGRRPDDEENRVIRFHLLNFMILPHHITATIFLLILSFQLQAQSNEKTRADTSIFASQTLTLQGSTYTGFLTPNGFHLVNSRKQVFLKFNGDFSGWELKDFNTDGYEDIYLNKGGNTPERFHLLLYIPKTGNFRQVENFDDFPAPIKIGATKYYYSYHKSGCADANWDSDLFYISNFKVIKIGNISGRQCRDNSEKVGLYISKIKNGKKILLKELSIDTLGNYKEHKWGFIEDYWTKNYELFLWHS